jgi:Fe-S-cluster containining protein
VIIKNDKFKFGFDDSKCFECGGRCCTGESGNIWINKEEMADLASLLDIDVEELKKIYLKKIKYKYSIKEYMTKEFGYVCAFFDTQKKMCQIYEARPKQCRTFPFWDSFINNIEEVKQECPAIVID